MKQLFILLIFLFSTDSALAGNRREDFENYQEHPLDVIWQFPSLTSLPESKKVFLLEVSRTFRPDPDAELYQALERRKTLGEKALWLSFFLQYAKGYGNRGGDIDPWQRAGSAYLRHFFFDWIKRRGWIEDHLRLFRGEILDQLAASTVDSGYELLHLSDFVREEIVSTLLNHLVVWEAFVMIRADPTAGELSSLLEEKLSESWTKLEESIVQIQKRLERLEKAVLPHFTQMLVEVVWHAFSGLHFQRDFIWRLTLHEGKLRGPFAEHLRNEAVQREVLSCNGWLQKLHYHRQMERRYIWHLLKLHRKPLR